MLLLYAATELEIWCYGWTIIENRKQQNTDNILLLVENCDIKLDILNKLAHLNQSETQITVVSELLFSQGFSLGHIIITTMISNDNKWQDVVENGVSELNTQEAYKMS